MNKKSRWADMSEDQKEASRRSTREWRKRHHEELKTYNRARYAANREALAAKERERYYQKHFGLTLADVDAMLAAQGNRCAICGDTKPGTVRKTFAVDHSHTTGSVRGILCIKCNSALGWYERHHVAIAAYLAPAPRERAA